MLEFTTGSSTEGGKLAAGMMHVVVEGTVLRTDAKIG
jgi:hypothetical protein